MQAMQRTVAIPSLNDTVVNTQLTGEPVHVGEPQLQRQSLLFSLPTEIRNIIYQHVFGPSLIHIESLGDRLAHVKCLQWQSNNGWGGHLHCYQGWEDEVVFLDNVDDPNDQLLALCLTCRIM